MPDGQKQASRQLLQQHAEEFPFPAEQLLRFHGGAHGIEEWDVIGVQDRGQYDICVSCFYKICTIH